MQKTIERIEGDTSGTFHEFPVFRFSGSSDAAPSAYLQAALHGDELPGVVAIDALMPKLRKAESEGRIRGAITIVPWANPIGRAQYLFGDQQGRFHVGTRTNFNRDFPLLEKPDAGLLPPDEPGPADARLKRRLVALSMGHDIVLDLHCDDEGVPYLYLPAQLWPAMADCAAAMGVAAVVLWQGASGAAFEEAAIASSNASLCSSGLALRKMSVRALMKAGMPEALTAAAAASMRLTCTAMSCSPLPPTIWSSKLKPTAPASSARVTVLATTCGSTP
jgi:predicted deacylase